MLSLVETIPLLEVTLALFGTLLVLVALRYAGKHLVELPRFRTYKQNI
jgi:hypothetical protein